MLEKLRVNMAPVNRIHPELARVAAVPELGAEPWPQPVELGLHPRERAMGLGRRPRAAPALERRAQLLQMAQAERRAASLEGVRALAHPVGVAALERGTHRREPDRRVVAEHVEQLGEQVRLSRLAVDRGQLRQRDGVDRPVGGRSVLDAQRRREATNTPLVMGLAR